MHTAKLFLSWLRRVEVVVSRERLNANDMVCDFKAINRYLRHHTLGAQRRWIARFVRARDIQAILLRYRAGMISLPQAKQELAFQQALLKAYELAEIEARLETIEAILQEKRL